MRAWQEKCSSCRRRRKVYAYQSLTFYCRKCWTHRDSSDSVNVTLVIGDKSQTGRIGPLWKWDARPAFVMLQGTP